MYTGAGGGSTTTKAAVTGGSVGIGFLTLDAIQGCSTGGCLLTALEQGLAGIPFAIFAGITNVITALMTGFAAYVIVPALATVRAFFGNFANGFPQAMGRAWTAGELALEPYAGPLSPVIEALLAMIIIGIVVVGIVKLTQFLIVTETEEV